MKRRDERRRESLELVLKKTKMIMKSEDIMFGEGGVSRLYLSSLYLPFLGYSPRFASSSSLRLFHTIYINIFCSSPPLSSRPIHKHSSRTHPPLPLPLLPLTPSPTPIFPITQN